MASFNRVILVGNLTRDVELRYTANQTAVTDIGLAVNDRRRSATGDWVEDPVFVDVTLWGRTAEIASQYLGKGAPVLIEGRLKYDTWEKDGQKRSKLLVVGERLQLLGSRSTGQPRSNDDVASNDTASNDTASNDTASNNTAAQYTQAGSQQGTAPGGPPDDEIPF